MGGKPVVIADDHPLFRGALKEAVAGAAPGRDIVETSSLAEARAAVERVSPGLLCLDLHMDDSDGFAGLIAVRQAHPALPVAVVSGSETPDVARRALAFGAAAFVPKSSSLDAIREAVATVLDGDTWSPAYETPPEGRLNGSASSSANGGADLAAKLASLTPTQLKVLVLVHRGLLNKQIAYELSVSEATVKAHLTATFRKLNVQTRTQAVLAAGALIAEPFTPADNG